MITIYLISSVFCLVSAIAIEYFWGDDITIGTLFTMIFAALIPVLNILIIIGMIVEHVSKLQLPFDRVIIVSRSRK